MKSDLEKRRVKPAPLLFSCRLVLFTICMFSSFNFLFQRINISFALVCMVKRPNSFLPDSQISDIFQNGSIPHFFGDNETKSLEQENYSSKDSNSYTGLGGNDDFCRNAAATRVHNSADSDHTMDFAEFEWGKEVQGAILASFYYGFLFTQIFGGWLAERFGAKNAFLGSIASLSLLTLVNPVAARYGPEFLFAVRLLQGLSHGAALPAINVFAARWCAPEERGTLMGIAMGGFGIATAFTFPICAFLCQYGWEWIFYFSGGLGIVNFVFAMFLVYEWPENHPRISTEELEYLKKTRSVSFTSSRQSKKMQVPWGKILTSVPINVVHVTHLCFTWGFLMVAMYMPTFLKEVLFMETSQNGLYSSLPYMGMLAVHFTVGSLFDYFRRQNLWSVTTLRKIFNTLGMVGPALSMILTGFLSCTNLTFGIAMVTIGQAFGELSFMGGYMLSIFELAPKYSGIIIGITSTFGVLPGFLCPIFVSLLAPHGSREEWVLVFLIAAGFNIFGAVLYAIFGSCELQPWAANSELGDINGANGNSGKEHELVPLNTEQKERDVLTLKMEDFKFISSQSTIKIPSIAINLAEPEIPHGRKAT